MRSSTEPTDTLGTFPSKPTEQAAKPSPAPVVRQISKHVREVNGRMETDGYPNVDPKRPTGLACRYTGDVLDLLDALGC